MSNPRACAATVGALARTRLEVAREVEAQRLHTGGEPGEEAGERAAAPANTTVRASPITLTSAELGRNPARSTAPPH